MQIKALCGDEAGDPANSDNGRESSQRGHGMVETSTGISGNCVMKRPTHVADLRSHSGYKAIGFLCIKNIVQYLRVERFHIHYILGRWR